MTIHSHTQPHITLVGAGPGDPELLTLKAVKAIASATVLLVDDLVSDAITAHATPTARIVYVGKRGGCTSTPQAFIEKLMVQEALAGETVVRLKGGDPFIFGRGGEELAHLQAQGIAVTVINGITSGLAGVTSLGIPLTHREHAHGVVFITGHAKQDASDSVDWVALGQTAQQAVEVTQQRTTAGEHHAALGNVCTQFWRCLLQRVFHGRDDVVQGVSQSFQNFVGRNRE